MSFQALMDELGLLAKAQNDGADGGDGKIDAAAAAGGDGGDPGAAETVAGSTDTVVGDGAATGGDGDDDLGKSFSFKLENGTEIEAFDGTELVKALMARVEGQEENFTKALGTAVEVIKAQGEKITSQGDLIKSMQEQIKTLSGEGRGRKTVVTVNERPSVLRKSEPEEGITPNEFMAKALHAQAAGRITGADVAKAEAYLNRGLAVPAEIVARVAAQ